MTMRSGMRQRPFSVAAAASAVGVRRLAGTVLAVALTAVLIGCGGDPRSVSGFCKRLREQGAALTDPSDPAGLAELYAELDAHAPLQIKDAWHEVTLLVARATTFDPKDPEDTQAFIAESLRAKRSVDTLAQWADVKCKVPLGNVLAPDDTLPVGDTAPVGPVDDVAETSDAGEVSDASTPP